MKTLVWLGMVLASIVAAGDVTPPSLSTPQAANTVCAGPTSGGAAISSFRQFGASELSGLGTSVATALGVNVGSAGAVVVYGGAGSFSTVTISTSINPVSNDGAALGDTTHNFSDLFLASGAVINFNNSNVTLTHISGILSMGVGELRIQSPGTNSTSVPTLGSTSTLTNKTLTAPVLQGATLATATIFAPQSDDGGPLGDGTHGFSDLFLASGGVLNWANGNAVLTHSSGILTIGTGELRVTAPGTNAASVPTISSNSTLTNKRITARVSSTTSAANPIVDTDTYDVIRLTAQAATIASMTTNISGTPTAGQRLLFEILDDGTARGIAWGASYASGPATLPTTTTVNKILYTLVIWSPARSKWICLATGSEQ